MKKNIKLLGKLTAGILSAAMAISCASASASARTLILTGDHDRDGVITSNDAINTLRYSVSGGSMSNTTFKRCDVDDDGEITSTDAVTILRQSAGIGVPSGTATDDEPYTVNDGVNDFSVNIFRECYANSGENTLVSPLSVYIALAMANNGASGISRSEMIDILGKGNVKTENINSYLNGYITNINNGDTLRTANSIFVMDRPDVRMKTSFIDEIKKDYFAEVFNAPTNDETVDKINSWVNDNTRGMIDSILDKGSLNENSAAILLNAVSFKAEWAVQYENYQIRDHSFTQYDGKSVTTDFLFGDEDCYISDENAIGFMKPYRAKVEEIDGQYERTEDYRFVAILPNKDITIDDYIAKMDDSTIKELVSSRTYTQVLTAIPKFKYDCTYNMNDMLKNMGLTSVFNRETADLTEMADIDGDGKMYFNKVLHKTYINLDENGTEAAAVTAIDICTDADMPMPMHEIYLDRPFIYAIYDMNNNIPVFIGTVCDITKN